MKKKLLILAGAFVVSACGVKGDPKPPLTPAALGHGQPSFRRATKSMVPAKVPDADASSGTKPRESSEQE